MMALKYRTNIYEHSEEFIGHNSGFYLTYGGSKCPRNYDQLLQKIKGITLQKRLIEIV